MKEQQKYQKQFITAMVAYAVLLIVSVMLLRGGVDSVPGRVLIAVVPVVPILFGLAAVGRAVRALDEFEQRIHLEALAFSLVGTGLLTFTAGLLENAGLPPVGMIWVLPLAIFLWGIGQALAHLRYR